MTESGYVAQAGLELFNFPTPVPKCWDGRHVMPAHSGQVVLGCIKMQARQVMGTKPERRIPLWSLLPFLSPASCFGINPALTSLSYEPGSGR